MFCPNCGTQNPESAQVCSKCNFNLKNAAAPKFKGTMLMMNQSATPAPPPSATPPIPPTVAAPATGPGAPPTRPNPAMMAKMKGTMVGVAPPTPAVLGKPPSVAPPAPAAAPPAPPAPYQAQNYGATVVDPGPPPFANQPPPPVPGNVPAPAFGAPPGFGGTQHSAGQGPVNPLGGTMAADGYNPYAGASPGGYAPPPPAYGGPPPPYGAPPPDPYGAPPPGYGGPPPGGPPPGYSPAPNTMGMAATMPQQGGFGPPPMTTPGVGGLGATTASPYPGTPMPGYGAAPVADQGGLIGPGPGSPMMGPMSGGMMSASGVRPSTRNPVMTMTIPFAAGIGGMLLGSVMMALGLLSLGGLVMLAAFAAGVALFALSMKTMIGELNAVTKNFTFAWWMSLVPFFGFYWMALVLPLEVTNAKRAVGSSEPVRSPVLYFFAGLYALAADLNDVAARAR